MFHLLPSRMTQTVPRSMAWLSGSLISLGTIAAIELVSHTLIHIPNPAPILITAVVYAALRGGVIAGLISAAWTVAYALLALLAPDPAVVRATDRLLRIVVLLLTTPTIALLVGWLKQQHSHEQALRIAAEQTRQQADAHTATPSQAQREQQWFEVILDRMPLPLLLIEPETAKVIFANKAADEMAGGRFPRGAAAEEYHTVYVCTDAAGQRIPDANMPGVRAARGERLTDYQMDWHTPTGTHALLVQGDTIPAMNGHPATVVIAFQDVTALKQAHAALHVSEERYRRLVELSPDPIFVQLDGRFVFVNKACVQLFAAACADDLIGTEVLDRVHPAHHAVAQSRTHQLSYEPHVPTIEAQFVRLDGSTVDVEIAAAQVPFGDHTAIQVVMHDISDRKHAERALRDSEERYRTFVHNSSEAIWCFELEQPVDTRWDATRQIDHFYRYGYLAECNDTMAHMYGFDQAEDMVGIRMDQIMPRAQPENVAYLHAFIESGYRLVDAESIELDKQGHTKYILNNLVAVVHDHMAARAWGTSRDITDRKQAELERVDLLSREREARAAAERAVQRIARLQAVTAALAEALTVEQVAEVVVEQGVLALDAYAGSVSLVTPDGRELEIIRSIGYPAEVLDQWRRFPLDAKVPLAVAVRTGVPVWLRTQDEQADQYADVAAITTRTQSQAIVAVPLWSEGRTIGALGLSFQQHRDFAGDDQDVVLAIARQCALGLERARLYAAERQARSAAEAAEHAKQESLALLDALFTAAPVALGFLDRSFRFVRINDALATIHGVPASHELGRTVRDALPELAPTLEPLLSHVIETGTALQDLEVSGTIPSRPGQILHWIANYYPVRLRDGGVLGVGIAAIEVTERKRSEQRERFLSEASVLLATSLDDETTLTQLVRLSVPMLADWCMVDVRQRSGTIKRVAVAHADSDHAELAARIEHVVPALDWTAPQLAALQRGQSLLIPHPTSADLALIAPADDQMAVLHAIGVRSLLVVPLIVRDQVLGVLTYIASVSGRHHDRSDLSLAEELARRAAIAVDNARLYHEAQEAIVVREEFLSVASHELRTPLTALQLQTQSLLRSLDRNGLDQIAPERLRNKLSQIDQQAERLNKLANDLLDVTRLHGGQIETHIETVDVVDLVHDIVDRFGEQIEQARCTVRIAAATPVLIDTDCSQLDQVVTNLLANAIKYGAGKPVDVEIAVENDGLRLDVQDHGIGIAPEDLERIFGRFERAVPAQHYGGLGLGLYIVRQIVHTLGGTIEVRSAIDQGATFTVRLPGARGEM